MNIKTSRLEAIELYRIIEAMKGSASYKLVRTGIQDNILKAWPEAKEEGVETPKDEVRELSINPREQRAIAEGLAELANEEKSSGAEFNFIRKVAKTCKVSNWFDKKFSTEEIEEFDGEIDGEAPLSDEAQT